MIKDYIIATLICIAVGILGLLFIPKDTEADWEIHIVYQNGDTETKLFFDQKCPKVEKSGCLYDYYHKSYICGVRDIYVVQVDNQQ